MSTDEKHGLGEPGHGLPRDLLAGIGETLRAYGQSAGPELADILRTAVERAYERGREDGGRSETARPEPMTPEGMADLLDEWSLDAVSFDAIDAQQLGAAADILRAVGVHATPDGRPRPPPEKAGAAGGGERK